MDIFEKRIVDGVSYMGGDLCTGDPLTDKPTQLCLKKLNVTGESLFLLDPGTGALLSKFKDQFKNIQVCNTLFHDYYACSLSIEKETNTIQNQCVDLYSEIENITAETILFRMNKSWEYTRLAILHILNVAECGLLYVYGANDEGAKSLLKKLKSDNVHGDCIEIGSSSRIFSFSINKNKERATVIKERGSTLSTLVAGVSVAYSNWPGVFSQKKLDEGSILLMETLPDLNGMSVLDVGCGAGVLSLFAYSKGARQIGCTDVNAISVACCKNNLALLDVPTDFYCTHITEGISQKYDVVITNPPFHMGKSTFMSMGEEWLKGCFNVLNPSGTIYLVANEFLKYVDFCDKLGYKVEKLESSTRFFVYKIVS